eukprot:TRINITY_DN14424_c0_g1_i1.p1 TRINITY_DN14424_c0_g1~~TRINITY_DN14424_c0_g1_i1.p1  ORF type:complete len:199 (+),score=55.28 TRINITY_DN14424_c0_g1_i1:43-639(+)
MSATVAQRSRAQRQAHIKEEEERVSVGCIQLRVKDDWVEYWNPKKEAAFYFCRSNSFITRSRDRTPFEGPPRPDRPETEIVNANEPQEFVPQEKPVSALISKFGVKGETTGGGIIVDLKDEKQESLQRSLKEGAEQFSEEGVKRRIEETAKAAEEKENLEKEKRKKEEEKQKKRSDIKRRKQENRSAIENLLAAKWGK